MDNTTVGAESSELSLRPLIPKDDAGVQILECAPRSGEVQYGNLTLREATIAIGFRRSKDFDPSDAPGQDFAIAKTDGRYVAGVVADGVSQSFFGEIAARKLAEELAAVLWSRRESPPAVEQLDTALRTLAQTLDEYVQSVPIPDHIPDMLRQTLEEIRQHGSQSVGAAFIFDTHSGAATLYQIGDVSAFVFARDPWQAVTLPFEKTGRFSSAGRSEMNLQRRECSDVFRILICSDGMAGSLGVLLDPAGFALGEFYSAADALSCRDDVSFVWAERVTQTKPAEPPSLAESREPSEQPNGASPVVVPVEDKKTAAPAANHRQWSAILALVAVSGSIGFFSGRLENSASYAPAFRAEVRPVNRSEFEVRWRSLLLAFADRFPAACSGAALLHVAIESPKIRQLSFEVDASHGSWSTSYSYVARTEGAAGSEVLVPMYGLGPDGSTLKIRAEDRPGSASETSVSLPGSKQEQPAFYDLTILSTAKR